jgi:NAD(P)-dependent dehydrogenase (short-subunit alcohol dehydrogenase family)
LAVRSRCASHARGAQVVISSRNQARLDETLGLAADDGLSLRAHAADLQDPASVAALFDSVAQQEGRVDILACIAGGQGAQQPLGETEPQEWMDVFARNVFSTYLCCRAVLPQMLERQQGEILTCAGGGAFFPMLGTHATAYASAKAAVCRFTDQLYAECYDIPGIRINCLEPGMTLSPLDLEHIAAEEERTGETHPARANNHSPEDGAELASFLLSPAAAELNGRILSVDEDWWRDPAKVREVAAGDLYRLRRTFL